MKILIQSLLFVTLIILFNGCNTNDVSLPTTKPIIDENLPVVDPSTIRHLSDLNSIALEWKVILDPNVKGYYIYRSKLSDEGQSLKRIDEVKSRYASHYLDTNLKPDTQYRYAIATMGSKGTESPVSQAIDASTQIRFSSVALIKAVSDLPKQIKIYWRPHTNLRVSHYILEKSDPKTSKWFKLTTIKPRLIAEYIDTNLKDNEECSYRLKAVTFDGVVSLPSQIATGTTKALPSSGIRLEATTTEPKKIQLTWTPPQGKDLIFCNIYSSNTPKGKYNLIGSAKITDNTYNDIIKENGKKKYYKITVVDKSELESTLAVSPVLGMTLPIPASPIMNLAMIKGEKAVLNWKAGDDRSVSYNIYKTTVTNIFSKATEKIPNIQDNRYEDTNILRGVTYEYRIEAVDQYGLVSNKTPATSLILPKLEESTKNAASTN